MQVPRGVGGETAYPVDQNGFYSTFPHSSLRKWRRSGFLTLRRGNRWLGTLLLSWLFYEPWTFSNREILLLADVEARQERISKQRDATFSDILLAALLAESLRIVANSNFRVALQLSDKRVIEFLTRLGSSSFLETHRIWKSELQLYFQLEMKGSLVPRFAPESGIDEEKSPKPHRIRGYTDHGSKRPADKWLPPPPSVEVEGNPNELALAELEEFWRQQRE